MQGGSGQASCSHGGVSFHRVGAQENEGHVPLVQPREESGNPIVSKSWGPKHRLVVECDRAHRVLLVHRRPHCRAVIMS